MTTIGQTAETLDETVTDPESKESVLQDETLRALQDSFELQKGLEKKIQVLKKELKDAPTEASSEKVKKDIDTFERELETAESDFDYLVAGTQSSGLLEDKAAPFNFQDEFLSLLKPAMDEIKNMTSDVRMKSDLRERMAIYVERLPIAHQAYEHVNGLVNAVQSKGLKRRLSTERDYWKNQVEVIEGRLQAANLQLQRLQKDDLPIAGRAQNYFREFFQRRGLYISLAVLSMVGLLFSSRLVYRLITRLVPGYRSVSRSFKVRLFDLIYRVLTIVSVAIAPLLVFFYVGDWLLLSMTILFLLGVGWTLTKTLPRYWSQVQLFLNMGSVREGERIELDGLPWRVRQINIFTELENVRAGLSQRVPIRDLVDQKSRPVGEAETWFPVQRNDWVLLSDGFYGKVTGISQELVALVDQGGSVKSYSTPDFLATAPLNLSQNFRILQTVGVSYDLQADSTRQIPSLLKEYIAEQIEAEGYSDHLINLQVEFQLANSSSLDIAVMADFTGEMGRNYQRLQRAVQRWGVDACEKYGWEIPFTQLTLHQVGQ